MNLKDRSYRTNFKTKDVNPIQLYMDTKDDHQITENIMLFLHFSKP